MSKIILLLRKASSRIQEICGIKLSIEIQRVGAFAQRKRREI
jgi:hypothetical protein